MCSEVPIRYALHEFLNVFTIELSTYFLSRSSKIISFCTILFLSIYAMNYNPWLSKYDKENVV